MQDKQEGLKLERLGEVFLKGGEWYANDESVRLSKFRRKNRQSVLNSTALL